MSDKKGCPGCKSLNETLQRERMFNGWVFMAMLKRVVGDVKRIVIEGSELKALRPGDEEPVIEQDPNRGTVTITLRRKAAVAKAERKLRLLR